MLLCLLLGGTASYSAAVVFVPIFILLALVLCCGCCALCMGMAAAAGAGMEMPPDMEPVSYTHLTLPTIYSV